MNDLERKKLFFKVFGVIFLIIGALIPPSYSQVFFAFFGAGLITFLIFFRGYQVFSGLIRMFLDIFKFFRGGR
ncbi:hypothetical protein [Holzapfeliella floricola]|uniref:hypothetical protein n=1 Tax=Holzapfeliella floricola TaxID=679249 RepID=UPI00070520F8|nr:hypothetical protein [Holzapfeliella floricola]